MIKVLLVDDEAYVRDSVARLVNWTACGTRLIGSCKDFFEAMDSITDEMPDIIVTDVKMPVFSGLDLIEKTHSLGFNIEYIVLSGYKEFEMAKTAMRFGVRHYILKPFGEGLIEDALQDCVQQIIQQRRQKRVAEASGRIQKAYLRQIVPLILQKRLDGFENGMVSTWPEDFLIPIDIYVYKNVRMEDIAVLIENKKKMDDLLMSPFCVREIIFLIYTAGAKEVPEGYDQSRETDLANISKEIEDFAGEYDQIVVFQNGRKIVEMLSVDALEQIDRLAQKLDEVFIQYDKDNIIEALDELLGESVQPEALRAAYTKALMKYVYLGAVSAEDAARVLKALYLAQGSQVAQEAKRHAVLLVQGTPNGSNVIERICHYIDEHYADESLSLTFMAREYTYMNQDYLGKLFCKTVGMRFSSYLTGKRIEIAKQLLAAYTDEKIYSVAQRVGFGNNPRYFRQLFKKATGMSPGEYAEKYKNIENIL